MSAGVDTLFVLNLIVILALSQTGILDIAVTIPTASLAFLFTTFGYVLAVLWHVSMAKETSARKFIAPSATDFISFFPIGFVALVASVLASAMHSLHVPLLSVLPGISLGCVSAMMQPVSPIDALEHTGILGAYASYVPLFARQFIMFQLVKHMDNFIAMFARLAWQEGLSFFLEFLITLVLFDAAHLVTVATLRRKLPPAPEHDSNRAAMRVLERDSFLGEYAQ
eukprot:m.247623 g.247623  ORF g.247623 m.247623 type:complete len:225 (-) comp15442_c0_seq1:160-834(-)